MLPSDEDDANTLIGLGLTLDQAKIYLTLARLGRSTTRSLATRARMDRANVYRVVNKLQEMNLIEKTITCPSLYQAVNPKVAIPNLLEKKKQDILNLEQKSANLIQRCITPLIQDSKDLEPHFLLIPAGAPTLRKVKELMARVNNEHKLLIYWKDIECYFSIPEIVKLWTSLKERRVTLQILLHARQNETIPKKITCLLDDLNLRFIFSTSPKCTIATFDSQSALISTSDKLSKNPHSLWVKNPNFVSIFENYFEGLWTKAAKELPKRPELA
jgi:sugar-specific transcriptional regulator TrmB